MVKRSFLVVSMFSLLVGCGGGGGGSTSSSPVAGYVGNTAQATVTTSNAKAVSTSAYSGSQMVASLDVLGKTVTDQSSVPSPLLQEVASILDSSVSQIVVAPKTSAKVVDATTNVQNTISGYSGSYNYSINVDTTSGSANGTLTFSQYKTSSTSLTMNGTLTVSAVFNQATSNFSSFNMTMDNIAVTGGSLNFVFSGDFAESIVGTTKSITMTFAITDNVTHSTTALKDYSLQLNNNSLTVSGTYYDPTFGYVVTSTITPLTVSAFSATPTSGQLLFTGSNGTKARLTFTNSGYIVEADTAGNGTFVVVQ